jgi:predicted nucleic acid-binding protein
MNGAYNLAALGEDIDEARQFTSVIVRMELLADPNMTPDEEEDIRLFLSQTTVIPLNETVEKIAVKIRSKTKIKLPDDAHRRMAMQ